MFIFVSASRHHRQGKGGDEKEGIGGGTAAEGTGGATADEGIGGATAAQRRRGGAPKEASMPAGDS